MGLRLYCSPKGIFLHCVGTLASFGDFGHVFVRHEAGPDAGLPVVRPFPHRSVGVRIPAQQHEQRLVGQGSVITVEATGLVLGSHYDCPFHDTRPMRTY